MSKNKAADFFLSLGENLSDETFQLSIFQGLIAAEISMRRQELGLSQQQLADKLGVSQTLVSRWETGDVNFTLSTLVKISLALGLQMQSPIAPRPPLRYSEHGDKIISFSSVAGWKNSVSHIDSPDSYTIEELKEN